MPDDAQRHILAINDDAAVLDLLSDLLAEEGYRVSTQKYLAADLSDVIDLAPDCIILDYMWADDDGGWSFLQRLKMEPKTTGIPIILCTGAVRQVQELKARLDEMNVQVVLKPFDIDELVGEVQRSLPATASADASD